ncbi:transmembrane protein 177 [Pectinophora gossypiella]|uniref:Transmembrane protein 177 n=1 Tax=Pectinophora gossypiella TaxID=13191 RepID=A0A1E1WAB7_PECGO|nr:transmembrane protein 177 [Pectinophora gossypiella]
MTTRRPVSWFLTERGRSFSFSVVTGSAIALTVVKFAPHTFLLEKYKEFVHYYRDSKPVELPKELRDRCQQCIDILQLPDAHRKLVTPFTAFGFDMFHAGSLKSKFGAAVGVPVNFTYKSFDDIQNDDIQVNMKKVNWESETGKKLADALLLPEKVQQFAICREILMTQNSKVIFESVYPFICLFFAYNSSTYLNKRLNLYSAPTMLRGTMYSLIGIFSLGLYFLMKDMTEVHYETRTDKTLCDLGPDFVESGVIFYDKLLKRNQALRELMGKEGEKKYTKLGNENYGIRHPRLALVHRKQFFEEKLKEIRNDNVDITLEN